MRVRENDGFELARIDRRFLPILFAPFFGALEKPAVDQNLSSGASRLIVVAVDEVFGTGNRAGRSEKL
jgi:hypothetical protein